MVRGSVGLGPGPGRLRSGCLWRPMSPPGSHPATRQGTDERFCRSARVRRRSDFKRVQREGRRVSLRHFVALLARHEAPGASRLDAAADGDTRGVGPGADGARLGIVASRRVGSAVVRNRIKRRLREWFRRRRGQLPAGIDLVLIVRPGADSLEWAQLVAELDGAIDPITRRGLALLRTSSDARAGASRRRRSRSAPPEGQPGGGCG